MVKDKVYLLLLGGFLLRVIFSPFGTLSLDLNTFISWSEALARDGFSGFYNNWSDYLPGYLYILYLLGLLKTAAGGYVTTFYKMPAILADIGAAYLIFKLVLPRSDKLALYASGFYLFNPAIFANSALWGQVDGLIPFFVLLAVYLLPKNIFLSALALSLGVLVKPQAAFAAPLVAFLIYRKQGIRKLLLYGLWGLVFFVGAFIPFSTGKNLFDFILERVSFSAYQYPYTSVNAFNFWQLVAGFWQPDAKFLVPAAILVIVATALTLIFYFKNREERPYLALSILFLVSFLFLTRIHERHLLPALAPLAAAAGGSIYLWGVFAALSVTYLANLYYSYVWITQEFREVFPQYFISLLSLVNLGVFAGLLAYLKFGEKKIFAFLKKNLLVLILVFAAVVRLINLGTPERFYFDEVYHAFTAREILRGSSQAWQYWATPPEGFAYEWTHPPLAKLLMVSGMFLLGENPWGWRLPGVILGVLSVFLVFRLGEHLFSRKIGLLAAGLFSLEGLPLVISRIGMNDIYFLSFLLLSLLLFFKDKYFWSALFLGAAISSKWTAFLALPIFVFGWLLYKRKARLSYLWYILLPPLAYLSSYIPFFTSGHTLTQWWDTQRQMWWYHTGLEATHPFTSPWYSWPLGLRPVWLFIERVGDLEQNIYVSANPVVLWGGAVAVIFAAVYLLKKAPKKLGREDKALVFLLLAYFGLFLPWALSPRIMFLYHYLPSTPFLVLLLSWVLQKVGRRTIFGFLLLSALAFLFYYPLWIAVAVPSWWASFLL